MKKFFVLLLLAVVSVTSVFADANKTTVKQFVRYSNGPYAELNTPQISIEKALETNNGLIHVRYDFTVNDSSPYYDVCFAIMFPYDVDACVIGLDGASAYQSEKLEENTNIIAGGLVPAREIDDDFYAFFIKMPGKKGVTSSIEFAVDVSEVSDAFMVAVSSITIDADGSIGKAVARGGSIVLGGYDFITGKFSDKFFNSDRYYTFLLTE